MTPAQQLRDIDRRAREAAADYKREAVALVSEVVAREGTHQAAADVLEISKQRVGQILKPRRTPNEQEER